MTNFYSLFYIQMIAVLFNLFFLLEFFCMTNSYQQRNATVWWRHTTDTWQIYQRKIQSFALTVFKPYGNIWKQQELKRKCLL